MPRVRPALFVSVAIGACLVGFMGWAQDEQATLADVRVVVDPLEATVGDRIEMQLVVTVPESTKFEPPHLGPRIGPFSVVDSAWSGPVKNETGRVWTWVGQLSAFRTGELEIPAIRMVVQGQDEQASSVSTDPVAIRIVSVLDPDETADASTPIADLKPPASIPPDYRPLTIALGVFALLLLAAGILWWLHRRYAARLAAVPAPDDPFHRTPPHVWVYAELQKLLDRRLAEEGRIVEFFDELSRILKRYLGGRFRIDLMERTTGEVPRHLLQAGAETSSIRNVETVLSQSDMIKFAKQMSDSSSCRVAIEAVYDIVDATKPVEAAATEKGAA